MQIAKNFKALAALIAALLATNVLAETNTVTTASPNDGWGKFKQDYDLVLLNEYAVKSFADAGKRNGYNDMNALFTYHASGNDHVRFLMNYWMETSDIDKESVGNSVSRYEATQLKYTRSGILEEEKDGVNLSAAFAITQYNTGIKAIDGYGWNTALAPSVAVSRKYGSFSLAGNFSLTRYLLGSNYQNDDSKYVYRQQYIVTPAYSFGNGFSVSSAVRYRRYHNSVNTGSTTGSEYFTIYPTVSYGWDNGLGLDLTYAMYPVSRKVSDGEDYMSTTENFENNGYVSITASWAAF